MDRKQFYGIKYPFVSQDSENYFVDMNKNIKDNVRGVITHVLFTPKGQKIRDPEFGTNLIKYIFEPNDVLTWDNIKTELKETIKNYLPNVNIRDINVLENNEEVSEIFVRVDYTVTQGIETISDSFVASI